MYSKTALFNFFLFISSLFFIACQQQSKHNSTIELKTLRLPLSTRDSSILSLDKSPIDLIYFPVDYPLQKMVSSDISNPVARVIYSRPQKKGRVLFADSSVTENVIQHYGQEWRLGANEATEIEFFKAVSIQGKKIEPGRYIMYCIPYPDKWKIIFNNNLYSWGLHVDQTKDLATVEIPVIKNNVQIEYFSMHFQPSTYGCDLIMAWGDIKTVLSINFN